jgi:hypothetical protein
MKVEPKNSHPVSLEGALLAVVEPGDPEGAAAAASAGGWAVSKLAGMEAVSRLRPKQPGLTGALSAAAAAFGDELRIADEIEAELRQGREVLVLSGGESREDASKVLRQHGALSVWDFGSWTFTRTADDRSDPTMEIE